MISPQSLFLLPDVALVEERGTSQDSEGGIQESWSTRYGALPIQVSAIGSQTEDRTVAGQFVRGDSLAYVTGDSGDIVETDRLTVGTQVYDIVGVQRYSGLAVTELRLERRQP